MKTVNFTRMEDGTKADYDLLAGMEREHFAGTAKRLLRELSLQDEESIAGYQVSRLEHALQTASRALADGADSDWIVCALLHDIGDGLAPQNHDKFAAEILRPFVREECTWVVANHGLFQTYYFGHHYGWDKLARDKLKDHAGYQTCIDFCARWDQASFDPDYDSKPLAFFAPMVEEVFARAPYDEEVLAAGRFEGLPRVGG